MFDLINSTDGIEEKLDPAIFIVVALAGAIVWETFETVGAGGKVIAAKDKTPEPFVFKNCPLLILEGKVKV